MRVFARCVVMLCVLVWSAHASVAQEVHHVNAVSAFVINPQTESVLLSQNAEAQRPIASLTKMMTAAVVFDTNPDLSRVVTVLPSDVYRASDTKLRARDRVSVDVLVHLMLISSDNAAARVLARTIAGSTKAFVRRMNAKAMELGLSRTHYTEPSGLQSTNVSTATDLAHLLWYLSRDTQIATLMRTPSYSTTIGRRSVFVRSTNHLVRDGSVPVIAGKTGYIHQSGFCLATLVTTDQGTPLVMVILGAASNESRFTEMRVLYAWTVSQVFDMTTVTEGFPLQVLTMGEKVCLTPDAVSEVGQNFIKEHEHFWARAYRDSGGYAIGYGMHSWKGRRVTRRYPGRVTQAQADAEFARQLSHYEDIVQDSVCTVLSQSAYDALVSVAWNLGRINTSIITKLADSLDVEESDFLATATVRGHRNAALEARRLEEFALFSGEMQL